MYIKYIKNGEFSRDENNSLYMLFLEEEILRKTRELQISGNRYQEKLYKYFLNNNFNLSDAGEYDIDKLKSFVKKYDFIIIFDKKNVICGYLCFEHIVMQRKSTKDIKDIFVIKHMYISNSQRHTQFDFRMFWLMENLVETCIIYSEFNYRVCNQFNGFCSINRNKFDKPDAFFKKKEKINYPLFMSETNRQNLLLMLSVIENSKDHCCKI